MGEKGEWVIGAAAADFISPSLSLSLSPFPITQTHTHTHTHTHARARMLASKHLHFPRKSPFGPKICQFFEFRSESNFAQFFSVQMLMSSIFQVISGCSFIEVSLDYLQPDLHQTKDNMVGGLEHRQTRL